jgi:hypothetical protein
MALFDNPPHEVNIQSLTTSRDAGGGTSNTFATLLSAVKCSINTASSSEREMFSQPNQVCSHTIAFLSSALTTALARGMKIVATDNSQAFHVLGFSAGRAYAAVPAFTYAYCESIN